MVLTGCFLLLDTIILLDQSSCGPRGLGPYKIGPLNISRWRVGWGSRCPFSPGGPEQSLGAVSWEEKASCVRAAKKLTGDFFALWLNFTGLPRKTE